MLSDSVDRLSAIATTSGRSVDFASLSTVMSDELSDSSARSMSLSPIHPRSPSISPIPPLKVCREQGSPSVVMTDDLSDSPARSVTVSPLPSLEECGRQSSTSIDDLLRSSDDEAEIHFDMRAFLPTTP